MSHGHFPPPTLKSRLLKWTIGLGLVAVVVVGANAYRASNQTVHVVNGLPVRIVVRIDEEEFEIGAASRQPIQLAEGRHTVEVTAPERARTAPVEFEFSNGWWSRFADNPGIIVDPTQSAGVLWQEVTYTKVPDPNREVPQEFGVGRLLVYYPDVDYLFQTLPEELRMQQEETTKTRLSLQYLTTPNDVLLYSAGLPPQERLGLYERFISVRSPRFDELHERYVTEAMSHEQVDRCLKFYEPRIDFDDVDVAFHRGYQTLAMATGQREALKGTYRDALGKTPENSSLLYLCGRLETRNSAGAEYYDRAIAADPGNVNAIFARALCHESRGEFGQALTVIEQYDKARPLSTVRRHLVMRLLRANGKEPEYPGGLPPGDIVSRLYYHREHLLWLIQCGDRQAVNLFFEREAREIEALLGRGANAQWSQLERWQIAYAFGESEEFEASRLTSPEERAHVEFVRALETGRLDAAVEYAENNAAVNAVELLTLATELKIASHESADDWLVKALASLQESSKAGEMVAELLRKVVAEPVDVEELRDMEGEVSLKRLYAATMAAFARSHRRAFADYAAEINFEPAFPARSIQRAVQATRKRSTDD